MLGDRSQRAEYQRWRQLAFLHWRVPVVALRPLIPDALAAGVDVTVFGLR